MFRIFFRTLSDIQHPSLCPSCSVLEHRVTLVAFLWTYSKSNVMYASIACNLAYCLYLCPGLFELLLQYSALLQPGAHPPVDLFPLLKYVPERWAPWKTICKDIRRRQRDMYFGLLSKCEDRMRNGQRNDCFMERVLDRQEEFGLGREAIG